MDTTVVVISILVGLGLFVGLIYYLKLRYKPTGEDKPKPVSILENSLQIRLQAYERLTLLADRIALHNLINRVNQPGLSAREMQLVLNQTIRQEFDHNITQQIYVTADAWKAVKNLKEQNMLVINQISNMLPATATGLDLNKLLLEFLMNDQRGTLHEVVGEVLSFEAKRLM